MNKFYIYLDSESDLAEIIEKLRATKSKEIILVIPEENKTFLHPVNLEILKKEVENLNKKVYLSTENPRVVNLARQYNLTLFLENQQETQTIVDVKPPKKKEKIKEEKLEEKLSVTQPRSTSKISFKEVIFYSLVIIFSTLIVFLLFQLLQTKAQVIIETQKSELDINEVITLDKNALKPDFENKILPAEEINLEINLTVSTSTTGKIFTGEQSLLKVTFLNYLEREIPLVAGTRLSYGDNIFRTTRKIQIPAKVGDNPGKITTEAMAFEIKDANLVLNQGTNLKIVALENKRTEQGLLWSDVLKAQVEENFNLTSNQKIGSVAPEDVTQIKLLLENALKENIQSALALKYPQSFYIFDPSLVEIKILNISHQVGEKTDKISAFGQARISILSTSQKEFNDFVKFLINQEILKQNKNLSLKELKDQEITLIDFDKRKKIETFGFKAKAILVPDLNPEKIKADLTGKSLDEAKNYFANIPGVNKISIKIFPQWKNNFPNEMNKIEIIIK